MLVKYYLNDNRNTPFVHKKEKRNTSFEYLTLGFQICWANRASKLRFYLVYFTDFVCGKSTIVSKKIEMPSCNLRKGNTIAGVFISYYLRVKKA